MKDSLNDNRYSNQQSRSRRSFLQKLSFASLGFTQSFKLFSNVYELPEAIGPRIIDHAFRLSKWENLLNLEFYFINVDFKDNCIFRKRKLLAQYGQEESYMIVRLPQQHIAEQSYEMGTDADRNCEFNDVEAPTKWTAVSRISGYSYLAFRIIFPAEKDKQKIRLKENELLDWNDSKRFRLVVKHNLQKSLFELKVKDGFTGNEKTENTYPLGYSKLSTESNHNYDYDKFPKVAGDPITALEFPWRLMLSPKLPNQDRFLFHWEFSKTIKKPSLKRHSLESELWFAKLSLKENPDFVKKQKENQDQNEQSKELKVIEKKLQLMMVGSPDYIDSPRDVDSLEKCPVRDVDGIFLKPTSFKGKNRILPTAFDRERLVRLYIKHKLLALTDSITLTPLGVSTFIQFKNDEVKENKIGLVEWKQLISFGRDEQVEVVDLLLEKEFGHKMLYIRTTKRRTKQGVSYLDYRQYIMPLEVEKDYSSHTNDGGFPDDADKERFRSKFNGPFKKVRFKEVLPKRMCPIESSQYGTKFKKVVDIEPLLGNYCKNRKPLIFDTIFYPLTYNKIDEGDGYVEPLTFEYEAEDWTNVDNYGKPNKIKFIKTPQLIPFELVASINRINDQGVKRRTVKKIDDFFLGNVEKLSAPKKAIIDSEKEVLNRVNIIEENDLKNLSNLGVNRKPNINLSYRNFKRSIEGWDSNLFERNLRGIKNLLISTNYGLSILNEFDLYRVKLDELIVSIRVLIAHIGKFSFRDYLNNDGEKEYYDYWIGLEKKFKKLEDEIDTIESKLLLVRKKYNSLSQDLSSDLSKKLTSLEIVQNIDRVQYFINDIRTTVNQIKSGYTGFNKNLAVLKESVEKRIEETKVNLTKEALIKANNIIDKVGTQIGPFLGKLFDKWQELKALEQNVINTIEIGRQRVTFAVQELEDKAIEEVSEIVSNFRTEYLLFKGELLGNLEDGIDFFNEYAVLPQLQKAQVFVDELAELAVEEIPVQIVMAEDYWRNQIDTKVFETKNNASMLFAQIEEESKEQVRVALNDLNTTVVPSVPRDYLTLLKDPKKIPNELGRQILQENPGLQQSIEGLKEDYERLVFIGEEAQRQWAELQKIEPEQFFKDLGAKILGSIDLAKILGVDFEMPRMSRSLDKVVYSLITNNLQNHSVGPITFYPNNKGKRASLQLLLEKSTKSSDYKSITKLTDFNIVTKIGGTEVLKVFFDKIELSSSSKASNKTIVKIDDVAFAGPLDFVGKLAESINLPGTGLSIGISPKEISVVFAYQVPSLEFTAFNLANLKFSVGLVIPLPTKDEVRPISTELSVNRPDDKFLVSVGIFGGRGHFVLKAQPDKIVLVDGALEFGGYFGINLGIAKGYVFLFAGIRFVYSQDGDNKLLDFSGYLICGGGVTVFGFISVTVTFFLSLQYQRYNGEASLYGTASVRYSVRIGFHKKSFTLSYSKRFSGSKGKQIDPDQTVALQYDDEVEELFYAFNDEGILIQEAEVENLEGPKVEEDKKAFNEIYDENIWEQYANSFNF